MATHSAKSLFQLNLQSAEDLIRLYDGIIKLSSKLDSSWLLRAAIVFVVSAVDSYFHDKIKYRAGRYGLEDMPPELAKFAIPLADLTKWEQAERKGNVIRNWLVDYFSTRPLQRQEDITTALKLVGIKDLWATIEPDTHKRNEMLDEMKQYIRRRNQIAHEGDRESSRRSGKKLRKIDKSYADQCIKFSRDLISKIERAFPN